MSQKRHVIHGRDHLPTGADPIPGIGGAVAWEDVGIIAPGAAANPVYVHGIYDSGGFAKVADSQFPSYTWYCPNWAFTGSNSIIQKSTLSVSYANALGTNDQIVLSAGWYHIEATWATTVPDTDTTPVNEHWLSVNKFGGGMTRGFVPFPSWAHDVRKTSGNTSPNPTIAYKSVNAGAEGIVKLAAGNGLSVNLRSLSATLDNVINSGWMLEAFLKIEKLPFTVGPP